MKEKFFPKVSELVALSNYLPTTEFDQAVPEGTTKHTLVRPLLKSLGCPVKEAHWPGNSRFND